MPYCQIVSNSALNAGERAALAAEASALVATMLGKPESYVMVRVESAGTLLFGGSEDPACFVSLASLGLPETETKKYSQLVCDFIQEKLEVPADRIYVEFSSPPRHMWGYNGSTFG